jgi:hypothetical protein
MTEDGNTMQEIKLEKVSNQKAKESKKEKKEEKVKIEDEEPPK